MFANRRKLPGSWHLSAATEQLWPVGVCGYCLELGATGVRHVARLGRICVAACLCVGVTTNLVGCAAVPTATPAPAMPTSAVAGSTTIVAVATPCPPKMTLPQFLGINGLFGGIRGIGQGIRIRLGSRFPGLEPRPPMLALSDPANLGPDASPAVQAAAKAKAAEDEVPQKAKAVRYLASLGCGKCHPDTEEALLAALEDCHEEIRYEAVRGLRGVVGSKCGGCRQGSCCTPELLKKLYEIAYSTDMHGCFLEPSSRVRRNARLVIQGCGGAPNVAAESAVPLEGPGAASSEPAMPPEPMPPEPMPPEPIAMGSAGMNRPVADATTFPLAAMTDMQGRGYRRQGLGAIAASVPRAMITTGDVADLSR